MAGSATVGFVPQISEEVPWHTRQHIQLLYQKLANHAAAFQHIKNLTGGVTNNTIENFGGGTGGGGSAVVGGVNNQTGQTVYTTSNSDNGVLLVVGDASPVTITLNSGVSSPFFLFISNFGTSDAALVPSSGTLTGASSLGEDNFAIVFYDGANWWATQSFTLQLEVNGTPNSSQTLLNLTAGSNITITDLGGGDIEIAASGALSLNRLPHVVTGSRTLGGIFQNTTGGEMQIYGYASTAGGGTGALQAFIGTTSPPTQEEWADDFTATLSSGRAGFSFLVPNNYFYSLSDIPAAGSAITGVGLWVEFY